MQINKISNNKQPHFSGVKINGVIDSKNSKNFGEFLSKFENIDFITNLENKFDTDLVLNSDFKTMTFEHKMYGNLEKYGTQKTEIKNYLTDAVGIFQQIKSAIIKAEKAFDKNKKLMDAQKRGC